MKRTKELLILMTLAFGIAAVDAAAETLQKARDDGVVRCGVRDLGPGMSYIDTQGRWQGFYPDICRAIGAAVTGDPENAEFIVTGSDDRFPDLRADRFDVLVESTTWTLGRDADGLEFLPIYLFDGQSFLYFKPSGVKTLKDLQGGRICVEGHTTSEANLHDYNRSKGAGWTVRSFGTMEGAFSAFFDRQCDAVSTDVLIIASFRKALAPNPDDYAFVPERISKEPLSAVVRSDDAQWSDVVRWVINALIAAEELGVTSRNLVEMGNSDNPEIRRLLGLDGDIGRKLGLDDRWAERAIRAAGNYGEIYGRNLGAQLGMERGLNELWNRGGLIWSPPIR